LPKLEFCGAVLLSRLIKAITIDANGVRGRIRMTDSQSLLAWPRLQFS
jgi:hypothetical protein